MFSSVIWQTFHFFIYFVYSRNFIIDVAKPLNSFYNFFGNSMKPYFIGWFKNINFIESSKTLIKSDKMLELIKKIMLEIAIRSLGDQIYWIERYG